MNPGGNRRRSIRLYGYDYARDGARLRGRVANPSPVFYFTR